jgi:hypothetical protein
MDNSFGGAMKKWLTISMAIGSLTACGGGSSGGSPTAPTAPPAAIAGSFSANLTASSSCAANLPFPLLGFAATITQTGAAAQVQLVAHAPGAPSGTVSGTVSGQTVTFSSFALSEAMGRGATLAASGNLNVAKSGTSGLSITGTLSGTFQTPSGSSCNATNHQLEMVKLCTQPTATGSIALPCQ